MDIIHKYFQIKQDTANFKPPNLIHAQSIGKKNEPTEAIQIYVKHAPDFDYDYTDFMEKPFLLVSNEFKKTVSMYNKEYDCKPVVLVDKEKQTQMVYWYMALPNVDYFLDKDKPTNSNMAGRKTAEFYKIDITKVTGLSFFMFQWRPTTTATYIIRLDLAESILRRNAQGFTLTELEHV